MADPIEPADHADDLRALLLAGQRFRQALADRFDLSLSETVLLGHLADAGRHLSPSELADRMLLGSGTLTSIIDRLARGGYVDRRAHPHDRRRVQVTLTAAGRRVLRYGRQHLQRAIAAMELSGTRIPPLGPLAEALEAEAERVLRRQS